MAFGQGTFTKGGQRSCPAMQRGATVVTVLTAKTVNFFTNRNNEYVMDDLCYDVALQCISLLCPPLSCATLSPLKQTATMAPPCVR